MTCPDIPTEYYVAAGEDSAVVSWTEPSAVNGDGQSIPVKSSGGMSGSRFDPGQHTIIFSATDANGYQVNCFVRFEVKVKICAYIQFPDHGRKECNTYVVRSGGHCTFTCNAGYKLVGQPILQCTDDETYDHEPPTCEPEDCGTLATPANANPFECPDGTNYQDTCSLTCDTGYRLTLASYSICRADGQWQKPLPECQDNSAPVFDNCPPTITAYADQGQTFATVTWQEPTASDNSGPIVPSLEQGLPSGSAFGIGAHTIKYVARDSDSNEAYCFFAISVQMIRCNIPTYDDDNMDINCPEYNYGAQCTISCRFGLPLEGPKVITCDKNDTIPPKGYWNHGTGPVPHCKETKCPKLNAPINGALACADWLVGSFCNMMCNDKFDIPRTVTSSPNFLCNWNKGTWSTTDVPDCTESKHPTRMVLPSELYYYGGDCSSAASQAQIKQNFIQYMTTSQWKDQCLQDTECKIENVKVECGATTRRKRSPHPWSRATRVKRSTEPGTATISWKFVIGFAVDSNSTLESSRQTHDTALMDMAYSVESDMKAGKLNNIAPGFTLKDPSMFIDWTDFECKSGQVAKYATVSCHGCPTGTRYDDVSDDCVKCDIGTYQDVDSSTTCIPCPPGTTTITTGARNITYCKGICSAGSVSPTGVEPCAECHAGYYQPDNGKISCIACPVDSSSNPGASSITDCAEYDVLIEGANELQTTKIGTNISDFTLLLWFQITKASDNGVLLSFNKEDLGDRLVLSLGNKLVVSVAGSQDFTLPLSTKWNHVAVVWTQNTKQILVYVGGTLLQTQNISSISSLLVPHGTKLTLQVQSNDSIQFRALDILHGGISSSQISQLAAQCSSIESEAIFNLKGIQTSLSGIDLVLPSTCDAFDECESSPCGRHICHNLAGGFRCECRDGYNGATCSQAPNYCQQNYCLNGATCTYNSPSNYSCHCTEDFRGSRCEIPIVHGGWSAWDPWGECSVTCGSGTISHTRTCDNPPPDAYGKNCEGSNKNIDICHRPPCPVCSTDDILLAPYVSINCSSVGTNKLQCHLLCNDGAVFLEEPIVYTCEEGVWSPGIVTKPCTKIVSPRKLEISNRVTYNYTDCYKLEVDTFIYNIQNEVDCIKDGSCNYDIILPKCQVNHRIRRNTIDGVVIEVKLWRDLPESELDITSLSQNNTVTGQLKVVTDILLELESSGNKLKNNISLVVGNGDGNYIEPATVDVTGSVICPVGSVTTHGICVICPVGTSAVDNKCVKCSKGFYQDVAGQTSCKSCPVGYITEYAGTIASAMCSVKINAV
ncbi:sushi, von Willebrand factor type A, EGF and pentraxin domain-containing protein 1 [Patella vulgata]|uniref:sushi, von Willebrand factor type A, EGF and pentraxin domain-containing protein 1 n=1 Tax=Patella vulgata TaxID=6465 RepID=UPI00217FECD4|nr:sushi, von Willebrand factor type A, EGF and pentraxin domain-containing protein 1 [Patella vulgata]